MGVFSDINILQQDSQYAALFANPLTASTLTAEDSGSAQASEELNPSESYVAQNIVQAENDDDESDIGDDETSCEPDEDADNDIKENYSTSKAAVTEADDKKRQEHEASEAKRKAEWDAKQQKRKDAEAQALQSLSVMTDDDVMDASASRVGKDTERLTRRNMKDCVTEYIQTLCMDNPDFARKVMHPRKNMINCFKYITRHALEYIKQELEDNGEPTLGYGMGSDVPDDLCYQWAADYFNDPDAEEDKIKDEEFVPRKYYGSSSAKKKNPPKKKVEETPKKVVKEKPAENQMQMMLGM